MNRSISLFCSLLIVTGSALPAHAVIFANFADDYVEAINDGETTSDVGIGGTLSGAWNYYEDADGIVGDGSSALLTFNTTSTGDPGAPSGNPGYEGSVPLFGTLPLPIVSSGAVFTEDPFITAPPAAGFLQVHPGDSIPYLAIEYTADANLIDVSVNYELSIGSTVGNLQEGNINYSVVQVSPGGAVTAIPATNLASTNLSAEGPQATTGALSAAVNGMAVGDSLWLLIDGNGAPFGDATNVRFEIDATEAPLPKLRVDTVSGGAWITGPAGASIDIDMYQITSPGDDLVPGSWAQLEDNPSFGNGNPNDVTDWEALGPGNAGVIGEAKGFGGSTFGSGGTNQVFLGNIFQASGDQDLEFLVSVDGETIYAGDVEYFEGTGDLFGDYNEDGVVDSIDYAVWRESLGAGSLPNEDPNASPGVVDDADFQVWLSSYGATGGGSGAPEPAAAPEPASAVLLSLLGILGFGRLARRSGLRSLCGAKMTSGAALLVIAATGVSSAGTTNDRFYRLGDEGEPGATQDQAMTGVTWDTAGTGGDDFQDIPPVGNPTYRNVSGRPFAGSSTLGIEFDGDDYLEGLQTATPPIPGLGSPVNNTNPDFDYTGITSRGIQLWAMPTSSSLGARQQIITDTYQFGIHITPDNRWGMTWGSAAGATTGLDTESQEPVAFNQWTHIQQHSFGSLSGVLYVDGEAVAISSAGQAYQLVENVGGSVDLAIGASLEGTPGNGSDGSNAFVGVLDDVKLYVSGSNISMDFGDFNLGEDNDYVAGFLAQNNHTEGDLTGDGQVTNADVGVFLQHWNETYMLGGVQIGDLSSRLDGDFDFSGRIGLSDWAVIRDNHVNSGALPSLGDLLANGVPVPEPGAIALLAGLGLSLIARRARKAIALLAVLALACGGSVSEAQLLADLQADYDAHTHVDLADGVGITDTSGTGQWGLFHSDFGDFANGSTSLTPLTFTAVEDGIMQANSYLGPNTGFGLPRVTSEGVFTVQPDAAADELAIHPGYPGEGAMLWLRWTSGITGTVSVNGWIHNISADATANATYDGAEMVVFSDAGDTLETYLSPSWAFTTGDAETNKVPVSIPGISVNAGDELYFRVSSLTSGNGDNNGLQLQILSGVFEAEPKLVVDRATGQITLVNNTDESLQLTAYSIFSDSINALDPNAWTSIASTYDSDAPGPLGGTVDPSSTWSEFTAAAARDNLAEGQDIGGNGAVFGTGASIDLGAAWFRNPVEDLTAEILVEDSLGQAQTMSIEVEYTGDSLLLGDFDFGGSITPADWAVLKNGFSVDDLSDMTVAETYGHGDINQDGIVDIYDARQFLDIYESLFGGAATASLLAGEAPEPSALLSLVVVAALTGTRRQRGV